MRDILRSKGAAHLVRAVRLSSTRFDRNRAMLACCPNVELVVLPDVPPYAEIPWVAYDSTTQLDIQLQNLKHVYWNETDTSAGLLPQLIRAAPNVEHLYFSDSAQTHERSRQEIALPPMPLLKRLSIGQLGALSVGAISKLDCRKLIELTLPASASARANLGLELGDPPLPTLPFLRTLFIFGSRSTIPLGTIIARCPHLEELSVDVWSHFTTDPPEDLRGKANLSEIHILRIHSAVTVVRDWSNIEQLFGILASSEFPLVRRIILHHYAWYRVISDERFSQLLAAARSKGSVVELPEGRVLGD